MASSSGDGTQESVGEIGGPPVPVMPHLDRTSPSPFGPIASRYQVLSKPKAGHMLSAEPQQVGSHLEDKGQGARTVKCFMAENMSL